MLHRVIMQALIIHWLRSWLLYGEQALVSAGSTMCALQSPCHTLWSCRLTLARASSPRSARHAVHDGGLKALSVMAGLADFIYVSYWFVILLQISMGWSIIRYEFLPSEYRAFGSTSQAG